MRVIYVCVAGPLYIDMNYACISIARLRAALSGRKVETLSNKVALKTSICH